MAKRTPAEVYAALIAAGFSAPAATTMTAISGAESGWDNTALGDVNLQTNVWGPSYGLFQVRTVKGDTGRGTDRDISRLAGSDAAQAKAAYDISQGGRDFSPWSVYTSGKYQSFLPAAGTPATAAASSSGPFPTWGPSWLPWNWLAGAGNSAVAQSLSGVRSLALEAGFVLLGIGLVGTGAFLVVSPGVRKIAQPVVGAVKGLL